MSVFLDLVGQEHVAAQLAEVARTGDGMTHAWLFTGPPGSGRSTAARAFAAALQCESAGCGMCSACTTALSGTHADVDVLRTSMLSIGVAEARQLVDRAARFPSGGRWQVLIVEDADRLTEQAANALLKAIEEPPARTVWLLCAPGLEDVIATIRSRCRQVALRTPPARAVADVLERRDGVDRALAAFAARASQGHIGRARRLATDEHARLRRNDALRLPVQVQSVADCLTAAANLVDAAAEEAKVTSGDIDDRETAALSRALGAGTIGRGMASGAAGQLKELEKQQKARAKRTQRDALDRSLIDLMSFYRDVLVVQLGAADAGVELVNEELRPAVAQVARGGSPESTLRRIDAVLACRIALDANVAPLLAVEAMALSLRTG